MSATSTNTHSLKTLAKSILNRLENNKYIIFNPRERGDLQEDLYKKLSKQILTEEDINRVVREQVGSVSERLADSNMNETDAFQSQKKALKARLGENELHGFYFQNTIRGVCDSVCKFLFDTPFVEDVFESDDAIQKLVLDTIQTFDETKIS